MAGVVMITLSDKSSHLFIISLVLITHSKDVVLRAIPQYNEVSDLTNHMNTHKSLFSKGLAMKITLHCYSP